jgi:hypothetical protein
VTIPDLNQEASTDVTIRPKHRRVPAAAFVVLTIAQALFLTGCRAFQPEAAVVNKLPETFITGAPTEHGGGYYRFHVYWYGRDVDGRVERFVWALTDNTVQDPDSDDDEENERFNPGLNASTLAIGYWTARTDSIFNFTIDAGSSPSAEKTLHLVAMDDRGEFDRTPARLHFFANSLGNPDLRFFRVSGPDTTAMAPGRIDTVGFGRPYRVMWRCRSLSVRGYGAEILARIDTVAPVDDGMLGYKWAIAGFADGNCNPTSEDCWRPRRFNQSTGDSFSYFGPDTTLYFANDGSDDGLFHRRLPSGRLQLSVNAIDIAGVEVDPSRQKFEFIVNYDPQTILLNGVTDRAHPEDPEVYPYYIRLGDPAQTHHWFRAGDRIPDRTYVVVKALARDDPRDLRLDPGHHTGFSGNLQCSRRNFTGGVFNFTSEASAINDSPAWGADADGWYGDTLGFLTAPNTEFTVRMLAIDELDRRDGTPASLSFQVGFPPCVQCLELLPKPGLSVSRFDDSVPCIASPGDTTTHPCLVGETDLQVTFAGDGPNDLQFYRTTTILVDKDTAFLKVVDFPTASELATYHAIPARLYKMALLLQGQDDPREAWAEPVRRIGGWRYAVYSACDPYNNSQDGGGADDIRLATWGPPTPQTINAVTGAWKLEIGVAVPTRLLETGPAAFRGWVSAVLADDDPVATGRITAAVTRQFGRGWVEAVALDQTVCGQDPDRPARFNFFRNVRPPAGLPAGASWRDCDLDDTFRVQIKDRLPLSAGAMSSLDGQPVRKRFRLRLITAAGEVFCGE